MTTDYTNTSGVTLSGICVVTIGDHGKMIIESGLTGEQAQGYAERIEARGRRYVIVNAESLSSIVNDGLDLTAKEAAPLRFQILREIDASPEEFSHVIQKTIKEMGFKCSGLDFDEAIETLTKYRFIEGFYRQWKIDYYGPINAYCFRITSAGKTALSSALQTYEF